MKRRDGTALERTLERGTEAVLAGGRPVGEVVTLRTRLPERR